MSDLLARTYYGNTVEQWALAVAILLAAVLAGKVLYWLFKNLIAKLGEDGRRSFVRLLLDVIEEPVVFGVALLGFRVAFESLVLPDKVELWITQGISGLVILGLTWLVARLVDALISEYLVPLTEKTETDLDRQFMPILQRSSRTAIWAFGLVAVLSNLGHDVGALIAGLGIGGIALAMAAKDTVGNIFGGFTVFTDHPFKIGDRIRFAGFDGSVEEIGLRSTRLRTLDGTLVTLPNAKFTDTPIENVSAEPSRKVKLELGLTYDMDAAQIQQAMATLQAIAAANERVEENVITGFTGFGDFALTLLFIYYIEAGSDYVAVQTELNLEILRQFGDKGLEMAFPTQTILHQAIAEGS